MRSDKRRTRLDRSSRARLESIQAGVDDHFARGGIRGGAGFMDLDAARHAALNVFAEELDFFRYAESPDGRWRCSYSNAAMDSPWMTHHRPPFDTIGDEDEAWPRHYHWLLTDPDNVKLCDPRVAERKGHYFPVAGRRSSENGNSGRRAASPERPKLDLGVLLEPGKDYPGWWLHADDNGAYTARPHPNRRTELRRGPRGQLSIDVYDLNRVELVEMRRRHLHLVDEQELDPSTLATTDNHTRQLLARRLVLDLPELLEEHAMDGMPGLELLAPEIAAEFVLRLEDGSPLPSIGRATRGLIQRALPSLAPGRSVQRHVQKLLRDGSRAKPTFVDAEFDPIASVVAPTRRHIGRAAALSRVHIENYRTIRELDQVMPGRTESDKAGSVVYLGENGVGKTAILEAIALGLAGPEAQDVLVSTGTDIQDLVRHGSSSARVTLDYTTGDRVTVTLFRDGSVACEPPEVSSDMLAVGFSALRSYRGSGTTRSAPQRRHLSHVFDPSYGLAPSIEALGRLEGEAARVAETILSSFLSPSSRQSPEVSIRPGGLYVDGYPAHQLSDGFRAVLGLVATVMVADGLDRETTQSISGVVLVDELGAHLHPRWRMKIVPVLRDVFPGVQFIASTHEPLCLRGFHSGEVHHASRNQHDGPATAAQVEVIKRSPSRMRVDQLLSSEFFGLHSTIDPDQQDLLEEYYEARQRLHRQFDELNEAERQALQETIDLLRPAPTHGQLGSTRREQLMFEVIDNYLTVERDLSPSSRADERAQALRRAAAIWRGASPPGGRQ